MSIQNLIIAANGSVPANNLKPHNCHEAVLGWVLQAKYPSLKDVVPLSHGVAKAWVTLRSIAERFGGANPKQLTGRWVALNIYKGTVCQITPPIINNISAGDIIFMGTRHNPHHSMVVVKVVNGQILARGFNNAGAFGGPFMAWDRELRNLADTERWNNKTGNFRGNNGPCPLHVIHYDQVARNIPDDMNF